MLPLSSLMPCATGLTAVLRLLLRMAAVAVAVGRKIGPEAGEPLRNLRGHLAQQLVKPQEQAIQHGIACGGGWWSVGGRGGVHFVELYSAGHANATPA